jgi:hypothetical protein
MDSHPLQNDTWLCGSCKGCNIIMFAPSMCPICSHARDYQIGCCINPGEGYISFGSTGFSHNPFALSREINWDHVHLKSSRSRSSSESRASSNAWSELSTPSLASSATDLSKHSGYSAVQIAKATRELIVILQEDELLAPLYKRAIGDTSIGAEKLERNLRRVFRKYADQLARAAGDTLELLASRLVKAKARAVAQSIVQKYTITPEVIHRKKPNQEQEQEQSSDEETEAYSVDETQFQDMVNFREFLVSNEAFAMLHEQIRSSVIPKSARHHLSGVAGYEEEISIPCLSSGKEHTALATYTTATTTMHQRMAKLLKDFTWANSSGHGIFRTSTSHWLY